MGGQSRGERFGQGTGRGRPTEAIPLPSTRLHEAGDLLGRALADDPLVALVATRPEDRTRAGMARLGLALVRHGLHFGEVFATGGWQPLDGVAVWLRPDDSWGTVLRPWRATLLARALGLPPAATWRFFRLWRELEVTRRRAVPAAHWHLAVLGVSPGRRGEGIEGALLAPMLVRAGMTGMPCAATSLRAREVLVLTEQGFRVVAEETLPGAGMRCWTLRRDG